MLLVDVGAVDFEGAGFEAEGDEAEGFVEGAGRGLGECDGEVDLFEGRVLAGAIDESGQERAGEAAAAVGGGDVDAVDVAFVALLDGGVADEGGDGGEAGLVEGAEGEVAGGGVAEAAGDGFEREQVVFGEVLAEGEGVCGERFFADAGPFGGVGGDEGADGEHETILRMGRGRAGAAGAAAIVGEMKAANALVLFDIDGTLVRKAGPHHREALEKAAWRVTGMRVSTREVPVAGMLDRDILQAMLRQVGMAEAAIRRAMPEMTGAAERIYARSCPDLRRKVCPGVPGLLRRLARRGARLGLVTGNLSRIGWKKMERAGLREYFELGAFAEMARDRAGLVKIAVREARRAGWADRATRISLIGDHANDVRAARANGVQAVAVATGVLSTEELAAHGPDLLLKDLRALDAELLLG